MKFSHLSIILTVLLSVFVLASCVPQPGSGGGSTTSTPSPSSTTTSTTSTTTPPPPCELSYDEEYTWWAAGDSVFAGVGWQHKGAPVHINGLYDRSFAGDTLVKVPQLPSQPTVRSRLTTVFCNNGKLPTRMVIQAGAADLFARATWQFKPATSAYMDAITSLDTWLKSLGVERVVWTTIIPTTYWSIHAPENSTRLEFNNWLLASGLEVIDCNGELTDGTGWLPSALALGNEIWPPDGAHLNEAGAKLHAACIVESLADPTLSLKFTTELAGSLT